MLNSTLNNAWNHNVAPINHLLEWSQIPVESSRGLKCKVNISRRFVIKICHFPLRGIPNGEKFIVICSARRSCAPQSWLKAARSIGLLSYNSMICQEQHTNASLKIVLGRSTLRWVKGEIWHGCSAYEFEKIWAWAGKFVQRRIIWNSYSLRWAFSGADVWAKPFRIKFS